MSTLIALALVAAVLVWLMAPGRRRVVAPEDDVETPRDQDELTEAEQELEEDGGARPLRDGYDDEDADDWGPGTR